MNSLPTAMAAAIEAAVNQVLKLDPDACTRIGQLEGRVIAVELSGLNIAFYIIPDRNGLNVFSQFDGDADTTLRGTPLSMMRMSLAPRSGDVLFAGDVEISGDVELGQQFQLLMDGLDIDWEEHLSHLTGDVIAHKLGDVVRGAVVWARQTTDTLVKDASEYLQEESRDLPTRGEVDEFMASIDTLRSDMDRTEARIKRLEAQPANQTKNINQQGGDAI